MHKPYLDGFGEGSRTDFKWRNNIAHNVIYPGDRSPAPRARKAQIINLLPDATNLHTGPQAAPLFSQRAGQRFYATFRTLPTSNLVTLFY
jgi:hypothetical protein